MYLSLLNENEKEIFLGIAFKLAVTDGDYSEVEQAMMNAYCQEMQFVFIEETMVKPIDSLIQYIKVNSDTKIKKIFIFELIGLAMADGKYDKKEKKLITSIMNEFNISSEFANNCENVLKEYISFQEKINNLVMT